MFITKKIKVSLDHKWTVEWACILALFGAALYLIQALLFAHTTTSRLDEGAYLYKGILFATGQYHPFAPYGVWTNKAPLSFLIPGYVQLAFGAGLRTGRYLAIFLGLLTLSGLWVASIHLNGNRWLAAAAVWILALSPSVIATDSQGLSQVVVACILTWTLALALGEKRPLWQLTLSGLLAGLTIMTRQNMAAVLPLLVLYIFWQHGWRPAIFSLLAGGAVLVFFHILYWPYIMQLWLPWLPHSVTTTFFPDLQGSYLATSSTLTGWESRMLGFFYGFRYDFLVLTGSLTALILWPKTRDWKTPADFRAAVFLEVLFLVLTLMHLWASVFQDYCVFCFDSYIAFFNVSGILLLVVAVENLGKNVHPLRQVVLALCVVVIMAGIGYSAFDKIGNGLLSINFPLLRRGRVGFLDLWTVLSNKFSMLHNAALKTVSASAGALVGLVLLVAAFWVFRQMRSKGVNYAYVLALTTLILGFVFSPVLAAVKPNCPSDVIAANEQVGVYLAQNIPPGSQVYWAGGSSVAPLLYLSHIKIYPAQLNDGSAFRIGGDPQQLLKYGFYNAQLEDQWLSQADVVIVAVEDYAGMKNRLIHNGFEEWSSSPVPTSCTESSRLLIFGKR